MIVKPTNVRKHMKVHYAHRIPHGGGEVRYKGWIHRDITKSSETVQR